MARKVKFNVTNNTVYMMIESDTKNQEEWEREIVVSKSDSDTSTYFSGKTSLGERLIDTIDIIDIILEEFPNLVIVGKKGHELRSFLLETYPLIKDKQFLIKYLNRHIGGGKVNKALLSLKKKKFGEVCIIHKDSLPESFNTRILRAHNIQRGFIHAAGSSKVNGVSNYNKLLRGESIDLVSGEFGKKMISDTEYLEMFTDISGKCIVKLNILEMNSVAKSLKIPSFNKYISITKSPFVKSRKKIIFWLRWNSWKKFEKIVMANTDLVHNPTEWDMGYGLYWREVNGKEKRFDEVYNKHNVDNSLQLAENKMFLPL